MGPWGGAAANHEGFSLLAPPVGLEPTTSSLTAKRSTIELQGNIAALCSNVIHTKFLIPLQLFEAGVVSYSVQGLGFNLADSFPGDAEFFAHLFQSMSNAVIQTETHC